MQPIDSTIDAVVDILRKSQNLLFLTGAGISADSGIPTYRGVGGMYDVDVTEEGFPIEEILSGRMIRSNPALTWKYLGHIADAVRGATFNRAHEVISAMEQSFERVWTLTQNVDGFHRRAGALNVIEIHGNMSSILCTECEYHQTVDEGTYLTLPPLCPDCNAVMRPEVVLFGEMLPVEALGQLRRELDVGFDAVFSVGTSSGFPYIQEPFVAASRAGLPTIEINPSETVLSNHARHRIPLGAAEAMDRIWNRFRQLD